MATQSNNNNKLTTTSTDLSKTIPSKTWTDSINYVCVMLGAEYSESKVEIIKSAVESNFKNISQESVLKALKNGSSGMYGKTYKLTAQEVCIWIREYNKSLNKASL